MTNRSPGWPRSFVNSRPDPTTDPPSERPSHPGGDTTESLLCTDKPHEWHSGMNRSVDCTECGLHLSRVQFGGRHDRLEAALADALERLETDRLTIAGLTYDRDRLAEDVRFLRERLEAAERLAVVALSILGQGSPGSYWIHWRLAARKFLGWPRGRGLFYDESGNARSDDVMRELLNSLGSFDLLHREKRQAALALEENHEGPTDAQLNATAAGAGYQRDAARERAAREEKQGE